ncbi:MAG TPA: glycosyltransferase [Solirubrobacterales bacterium]
MQPSPSTASGAAEQTLRVLYVCYLSLEDPLVHSQVVAYLAGLAELGHTVHLLTFEPGLEPSRARAFEEQLGRQGIVWHSRRYHKAPSLPATAFDVFAGALTAARLVRRHRLDAIHARNHVPAAMAMLASRLTGCRMIFDLRGLMAEEYADAGNWKRGGAPYRLTQWVQRAALRRADGVVTLTEAVRPHLSETRAGPDATFVVPCCADVEAIASRADQRELVREEIGIDRDRPVMVYVGKFTGWYLDREMAEFVAAARRLSPDLLPMILTQADPEPFLRELPRLGIEPQECLVLSTEPGEIGRFLAAADVGISFVKPCFSKISSSPTKIGEYLAAGLPVVSTAGIGDVDALLRDERVGVLIDELGESAYESAALAAEALRADPGVRERCLAVARTQLSLHEVGIPRYDALYRRVAAGLSLPAR